MPTPFRARIRASAALPAFSSLVLLLVALPLWTSALKPAPVACVAVRTRRGTAAVASTGRRPCGNFTMAHVLKHDAHGRIAATATALRSRPIDPLCFESVHKTVARTSFCFFQEEFNNVAPHIIQN